MTRAFVYLTTRRRAQDLCFFSSQIKSLGNLNQIMLLQAHSSRYLFLDKRAYYLWDLRIHLPHHAVCSQTQPSFEPYGTMLRLIVICQTQTPSLFAQRRERANLPSKVRFHSHDSDADMRIIHITSQNQPKLPRSSDSSCSYNRMPQMLFLGANGLLPLKLAISVA